MMKVGCVAQRYLVLAVLLVGATACKGGGQPTSATAPTTTPPVATTTTPLPYGQATAATTSCPSGSPSGSTCTRLVVSCPSVQAASAILRVALPAAANRGTIVLTTGGDGTAFTTGVSTLAPAMIATFRADGLTVVDMAWEAPGIWGGPRARTLACRYATAVKWTNENVHVGGRSALFAAQGTSGGSSQIAFGLAHYGVKDFLDLANLGGGPPGCPLCSPDGQNPPEPLLPAASPPNLNRDPLLSYPSTVVRFFLGDQEPTPDIVADANAYHGAITSAKSFTIVPGTAHNIEQTQAGVDAFVAAVRAAMR